MLYAVLGAVAQFERTGMKEPGTHVGPTGRVFDLRRVVRRPLGSISVRGRSRLSKGIANGRDQLAAG
jgi:hypothetical protein